MKKTQKIFILILFFFISVLLTIGIKNTYAYDEYVPTYSTFKSDNFDNLTFPDSSEIEQYFWDYSALFFINTEGAKKLKLETENPISGSKSLKYYPSGDSLGWTPTNHKLGISATKTAGSSGGYLLKLELKIRLEHVKTFVIHAYNSSDEKYQEMVIDGEYNKLDNDAYLDDDSETIININKVLKSGSSEVDYCSIEFIVRSPIQLVTYYDFGVQVDTNYLDSACVIMDDVVFSKENEPNLPYYNYKDFIKEEFELSINDSIFSLENENTTLNKNVNLDKTTITNENIIKDDSSLMMYSSSSSRASLVSKTFNLNKNNYKLYFKFKTYRTNKVGINVIDKASGEIIYNFILNISTNERCENVINPLFDSSDFTKDSSNIYTCYGEFEVEDTKDVYLELVFDRAHSSGYVIFDDINILEAYQGSTASTTYPTTSATKIEKTEDATYEKITGLNDEETIQKTSIDWSSIISILVVSLVTIGCVIGACLGGMKFILPMISVLLLSTTFLVGCSHNKKTTTEKIVSKTYSSGYQAVSLERIDGQLNNPGIGWVILEESTYGGHIDLGSSGDLPEAGLAALSTTWQHIETSEDYYDFTLCDQAVDYWNSTGRRVMLRISTDSCVWPYTYNATPSYLFTKYNVGYEMVDYTDSGPVSTARVTDIRNTVYLERLDKFLNALYEHYKDNPMVDTVEIRGFGMWGEWHHGYPDFESKEDRVTALSNIIDKYYNAFLNSGKLLVVSCSYDPDYISTNEYEVDAEDDLEAYLNYVEWSAFDKAWRMDNVSFRRDGGASALRYDYDERLISEAFRSGKRVPILGEYANNYYTINSAGSQYTLESALDDILYKIRPNNITSLGWVAVEFASIIANGDTDFIDRGNLMMGYRLSVDEAYFPKAVATNTDFYLRTTWANTAVGIYPYLSNLNIHLIDSNGNVVYTFEDENFDAREFVQGESYNEYSKLNIPSSISEGTYSIAVSIPFNDHGETEADRIALASAGEIGSTRMYKLGEITVDNNAKLENDGIIKTNYSKVSSINLDSDSIYKITFHYNPHMKSENYFFGNNDAYKFSLVSEKANTESNIYYFQDISEEDGIKTITVTTDNYDDYKIKLESINFDSLGIDEIWIEKEYGTSESFTGYDVESLSSTIYPVYINSAYVENSIYGDSLILSSRNTDVKHLLAKTDPNNLSLTKGHFYSVTFDFKADGDVGSGGYYFIALGSSSSYATELTDDFKVIGEWYERDDTYVTKKTFNFIADDDNLSLYFGICMSGLYSIDNLIVIDHTISSIINGEDLGYKHNVIPTYDNIGLGHTESFEKGTFQASGFNWGQFAWGRITFNPNEVVNYSDDNKASLLGRVEVEAYDPAIDNVWFEFARTKREYYPFEANKFYRVQFDYVILNTFGSDNIFVFFRDDTLSDRFVQAINNPYLKSDSDSDITTGKVAGTVYHFDEIYKMGDHDNYQFMICMHGMWEISVDNILIEEVSEPK